MARDKRPWAKIDTGYMLNPKWFQLERAITDAMANRMASANGKSDTLPSGCHAGCHEVAITSAVRVAREAHLASILYCAQNRTDGLFPVRAIKALVAVQTDIEEEAITALFTVGLWHNHAGGMAEVNDYLKHQEASTLSQRRSEAGKKGAKSRWQNDGKSHESANGKTIATANAEKRREEKNINTRPTDENADAFSRPDVKEIFDYFTDSLKKLGVTRLPGKNKTNATAIRRLLDTDKRTVTQIKAAIDFAHNDPFWKANILSLSKLREQYEQLRLKAQQQSSSPQQKQNDAAHDRWALARANAAKQRNGGDAA